jgi:hypothetical protein
MIVISVLTSSIHIGQPHNMACVDVEGPNSSFGGESAETNYRSRRL